MFTIESRMPFLSFTFKISAGDWTTELFMFSLRVMHKRGIRKKEANHVALTNYVHKVLPLISIQFDKWTALSLVIVDVPYTTPTGI